MAKVVWPIVYLAFNIISPKNITNLFENKIAGVIRKKEHIRVSVSAFLWAL
jgi:hypothetical protein